MPRVVITAYMLAVAAACTSRSGLVLQPSTERPELVRPSLPPPTTQGVYAVDAGGRAIRSLEAGSTLHIGAQGLRPLALYEFQATLDDGRTVSFARASTDQRGNIEPFVLWYESGVVGCAVRENERPDPRRLRFRTFNEAERALTGRRLVVTPRQVRADPTRRRLAQLPVGAGERPFTLPLSPRRSPTVFPSDSTGCLVNASETGTADMFVSGINFTPGERLELSVVPNQRAWYVGDLVADITGAGPAGSADTVRVGADGRFTLRVWPRDRQGSGAYDIVARRRADQPDRLPRRLEQRDIVSFGTETAYLLFLTYPPGGPHMDIAGRPLGMTPYFEFSDAFAQTSDPMWGAVDPTYVPAGHTGGTYAAYYVVNHKTSAQWTADNTLTDVSSGIEIHPVKAGCVNGTDVIIWNAPLNLGQYDIVVEFGSATANSAASFSGDGTYDSSVDFLDGAIQVGATVARDPYELGPIPIGNDSYSSDDFFPTLGGASNVDLRAVVRYPATAPGVSTPVVAGTHPLFLIEHGNHSLCQVLTDGTPWYQALKAVVNGTMSGSDFSSKQHTHTSCPVAQREPNHLGYMRLLDILASHGVIAVSIDAYDLTGSVPGWITERGNLILRHVELWSHMNNAAQFPTYPDFFSARFAGKVDLSRIGISGHSRGGEASVAAYMLNAASATPFAIGSVSSIAPVDFQAHTLSPAVPYFVILPSADCDVSGLSGQRIYDRAGGGGDAITKSAIDVYGANHNFFNTEWAADWDDCYPTTTRQDYIAPGSQQRIGEAHLAAFHRAHLLNEAVYDEMFRASLRFPSLAAYKIYGQRHETNHAKHLSGGVPAALTAAGGATLASASNPSPHSSTVTRMGWPGSGAAVTYSVPAGQRDASGFEVLAFRVAQTTSSANPVNTNQNFLIELVGGGVTRAVYIGQFDVVPPRYPHPEGQVHTVMSTVRVPLHSFIMNNSGLTLNNVDTIRLRFFSPATGEVYVDDVEFSR